MILKGKSSVSISKQIDHNFLLNSNEVVSVFLNDLSSNDEVVFDIEEGATLNLSILADKPVKNLNLTLNLKQNSEILVYFADFSIEQNTANVVVNLNGENAKATWHLASLSGDKDDKHISVSVYHNHPQTFARVDNYGVAKGESKLVFSGTSHILKGSIKSKTEQNAKIMVFDPKSDAVAKPILKIDENDIEASHAAAVGKISDEHLFYLTSRGLSVEDARLLITLGYLKPIFKGFDEDKVEYMNELIGGRL